MQISNLGYARTTYMDSICPCTALYIILVVNKAEFYLQVEAAFQWCVYNKIYSAVVLFLIVTFFIEPASAGHDALQIDVL